MTRSLIRLRRDPHGGAAGFETAGHVSNNEDSFGKKDTCNAKRCRNRAFRRRASGIRRHCDVLEKMNRIIEFDENLTITAEPSGRRDQQDGGSRPSYVEIRSGDASFIGGASRKTPEETRWPNMVPQATGAGSGSGACDGPLHGSGKETQRRHRTDLHI